MVFRLIGFITVFVILLLFIVFNLDNRSDINFGFARFQAIPVFVTIFVSFIAGMLCALPFAFGARAKKKNRPAQGEGKPGKKSGKPGAGQPAEPENASPAGYNQYGID